MFANTKALKHSNYIKSMNLRNLDRPLIYTPFKNIQMYLNSGMTAKIEVKLRWVSNFGVNCGASRDVATLSNLEYKQSI